MRMPSVSGRCCMLRADGMSRRSTPMLACTTRPSNSVNRHLAHALMNIGVELDRADRKQEAVEHLEHARDVSFRANKAWAALIHAYLSQIYASNGDGLRFQRASETAQTLAIYL